VVEGVIDGTYPFISGARKNTVPCFFCDIVGFTKNRREPQRRGGREEAQPVFLPYHRNNYPSQRDPAQIRGDMIMAFWNVMVEDEDAPA